MDTAAQLIEVLIPGMTDPTQHRPLPNTVVEMKLKNGLGNWTTSMCHQTILNVFIVKVTKSALGRDSSKYI